MKPQIKPTAMPCTEEQWLNEMKPLCDKHGLRIFNAHNFDKYPYLVNNANGESGVITSCVKGMELEFYRTLIPYHPELFMYNSGIFPEKWCVRGDGKEFPKLAKKMGWDLRSYSGGGVQYYYIVVNNELKYRTKEGLPADHVEVTLEELMFHYEQKTTTTMATDLTLLEPTQQPKWEDRTSKEMLIEEIIQFYDHYIVKLLGIPTPSIYNTNGSSYYVDYGNLIPYNPLKAQLLAEKEELKKRIEEIEKQLNR